MILIVDDHEDTCEALVRLCHKRGLQAKYVMSGDEALAEVWREKPDVVLLDQMMPGKTGLQVLESLGREGKLAGTRIVFLSAVYDWETYQKAVRLGASAWHVKGAVRLTDVVDEVAQYCEHRPN